jgi:transcriptional regulator with XRE-family HTH domain
VVSDRATSSPDPATELAPGHCGFADLLARFRAARGISQNALALRVGVDASYLNRVERAERDAPKREIVERLARALDLSNADADRLLVAAGHLPRSLAELTPLDPTIWLVADLLADQSLPMSERAEFRRTIEAIARRWRRPNDPDHTLA